jgi:HAD superfamily phosphatase (TIGR01668 family)
VGVRLEILVGRLWLAAEIRGTAPGRVEGVWKAPRIPGITRAKPSAMLGPDRFVPRLHDVPHEELEAAGIRGLIVDLDNTLLGFQQTELAQEHLAWVARAHDRGFRIVMLSNNFSDRVRGLAAQLNVACIPNALKPLPFGFLKAKKHLNMRRREIAVVGDQLFTDVLGGKLCGLYTILTEPIELKDFAITKFFRFFERLMLPERRR